MPVRLRMRRANGDGDERTSAPGAILAGIESIGAERMRNHRFRLEVLSSHATGIQATRNILCAGDQATIEIEVCSWAATAMSACAKSGGNVLPRLSARRRMPRQAVELK